MGHRLDARLLLYDPGRRHGVHPEPGPRPVRDVYGVDATLLQPARCLDDLPDGVTARQVDLDRHSEAGTQPLGEVIDVSSKADEAADELGEAGVGEGSDGPCSVGHLPDDLHHPLRTYGTV